MFGVVSFDMIIGNPPYVQLQKNGGRLSKIYQSVKYSSFFKMGDLYCLFYERGWQLLNNQGILSLITPNTWLQSITFNKTREFLTKKFVWHKILINNKIFDATVDTHTTVFSKSNVGNSFVDIMKKNQNSISLSHRVDFKNIKTDGGTINILQNDIKTDIFNKIIQNQSISKTIDVYNGVKPFEKGKGKPPQSEEIMLEKPYVKEGFRPSNEWMPLLRGSLIKKFTVLWDENYWILYGEWLAAKRNPKIFEYPEKIIVRQTGDRIIATYINSRFICRDNLHILIPQKPINLRFILGVLNSKLIDFIYTTINPEKGEALAQVKKNHIEQLPIRYGNIHEQEEIESLVNKILSVKKINTKAEISELEHRIDIKVYKLYDLSYEEAKVIDPELNKNEYFM